MYFHILSHFLEVVVLELVEGQQAAPYTGHNAGEGQTDAAGADDAHRLAMECGSQQPVQVEVALAHAVVRAMCLAVQNRILLC